METNERNDKSIQLILYSHDKKILTIELFQLYLWYEQTY